MAWAAVFCSVVVPSYLWACINCWYSTEQKLRGHEIFQFYFSIDYRAAVVWSRSSFSSAPNNQSIVRSRYSRVEKDYRDRTHEYHGDHKQTLHSGPFLIFFPILSCFFNRGKSSIWCRNYLYMEEDELRSAVKSFLELPFLFPEKFSNCQLGWTCWDWQHLSSKHNRTK